LIVFATLDSHTVFSSLSSLRLDNFVFTKESLVNAKKRLRPGGGIAINFLPTKEWLFLRHYNTLREAVGTEPLIYTNKNETIMLAGDIFDTVNDPGVTNYLPRKSPTNSTMVEPTSDDWPFLFLEKRGVPFHYILPLLIIFVLSFIPLRISRVGLGDINWHLFFMGAAFLLVETKAVTTLALIIGSTWVVNSVVFSAVLIMILIANLLIIKWPASVTFTYLYIPLSVSLLFNYAFDFDLLNLLSWDTRLLLGGFIIGFPLFFAALIFAKAFAVVESPSMALASNLIGALVGGLLEYLDMLTGLRFLNIIALILYGLSFIFLYIKSRRLRIPIESKL